jgi:hypothetical protein
MKSQSDTSFAAYVGVDWADSKHDFCLQAADSERREPGVVAHTPEAIVDWASALRRRFAGPRRNFWSSRALRCITCRG